VDFRKCFTAVETGFVVMRLAKSHRSLSIFYM